MKLAGEMGWRVEWPNLPGKWDINPAAMRFGGGIYPTLISPDGDAKIALDGRSINAYKGYVNVSMHGEPDTVTVAGIWVDPAARKAGRGTAAMEALKEMATRLGMRLQLEPEVMGDLVKKGEKYPNSRRLRKWYGKLGFVPKDEGVMQFDMRGGRDANPNAVTERRRGS